MDLRLILAVLLHKVVVGVLLTSGEKCSCTNCQAVMRRHDEGVSLLQTNSIDDIDQKLVCERSDGNLTHQCSNFCARDCRAALIKKFSVNIPCEANPGKPRSTKGISLSQLSVAYKMMACPEPLPCICTCNCPPVSYGTPLPPPPLPPFATASPPQLSVGLIQTPTGVPQDVRSMYERQRESQAIMYAGSRQVAMSLERHSSTLLSLDNEMNQINENPPPPPPGPPPGFIQVGEHTEAETSGQIPDIVLGPPPPPAPPLPPPVARGACPKSAGCNCYCPCRGEPQR